jgi:serine/threonine protein kinase
VIDKNTKVIGQGQFGKVFATHNKHNKDLKVAIKVMNKKKLWDCLDAMEEEMAILVALDHPNIVKYYETYNDD